MHFRGSDTQFRVAFGAWGETLKGFVGILVLYGDNGKWKLLCWVIWGLGFRV